MASWAAFLGLTGVLVVLMVGLARVSRRAIAEGSLGSARPAASPAGGGLDARLPRFESPSRYAARRSGGSGRASSLSTGGLFLNVVVSQGLFGALLAGAAVYFAIPAAALGIERGALALGSLALGGAVGVGLWLSAELAGAIADAAGVAYDETLRELLAPSSVAGWVVLLGAILPTVAVVEELIFRGAAIGAAVAGLGAPGWLAAAVSSVAFGAAHGIQGRVGMALATGLGLALAALFLATGNLVVVIVAHYLVNALEFLLHEGLGVDPLG